MSDIQLSMTFLARLIREKTGSFLSVWLFTTIIFLIPTLVFITLKGALVSPDVVLSNIFRIASKNLNEGVQFAQAIPREMFSDLYTIICLKVIGFIVLYSFAQGAVVDCISNEEKISVGSFFRSGFSFLGRIISANILVTVSILFAVAVGFGIGAFVFVIASLLIFTIVAIFVVYIYVRFAFTPFTASLDKKSWLPALTTSMDKTQKSTGTIAGIVIVTAILTQILSRLTGNIIFVTEAISAFILIAQLSLLYPLYKKATK
jgi:hypothetical protein